VGALRVPLAELAALLELPANVSNAEMIAYSFFARVIASRPEYTVINKAAGNPGAHLKI